MTARIISTPILRRIHRRILRWYRNHGRDLPWRRTRIPYRILISELMLQQTQVSRVEPKYRDFLLTFPSLRKLARASRGRVISQWQGLGYNRRAIWLHQLAQDLQNRHNGRFPKDYAALRELKGIGDYTARALRCFAFGMEEAVVDVNIRRVLARLASTPVSGMNPSAAQDLLPPKRSYEWNQALMDIGARFCTARRPLCDECPVSDLCLSSGNVHESAKPGRKPEPQRHGIPRRIYRGRILRTVESEKRVSGRALARAVGLHSSHDDMRWLRTLAEQLHEEGLLELNRSRATSWFVRKVA